METFIESVAGLILPPDHIGRTFISFVLSNETDLFLKNKVFAKVILLGGWNRNFFSFSPFVIKNKSSFLKNANKSETLIGTICCFIEHSGDKNSHAYYSFTIY